MSQRADTRRSAPLEVKVTVHGLRHRVRDGALTALYRTMIVLAYFLLLAPLALVIIMSFTETIVRFPPQSFSTIGYQSFWADENLREALNVSIRIAAVTMVLTLAVVGPAAYAIDRYRFPGRNAIETAIMSSLLVPNMVIAIGLAVLINRLHLPRNIYVVAAGHMAIAAPFTLRVLLASLATFERALEEASAILGARPWQTVLRVTIPILRPGIIAAGVLAFAASFGNVTISVFLAGVGTTTLPVEIFANSEFGDRSLEITAVSSIVIAVSVLVVIIVERTTGLKRVF